MKLLLNHKGVNKILPKIQSYQGIIEFVKKNFSLQSNYPTLTYIDSDGDNISLTCQLDVQTMLDTSTKEHLKIYIQDEECKEAKKEEKVEQKKNVQEEIKEEKVIEEEKKIEENHQGEGKWGFWEQMWGAKSQGEVEEKMKEKCKWKQGQGRKWKQKFEEKMSKFVDERLQALIPCIANKIESKIEEKEFVVEENSQKVQHDVKCNGCGVEPILGIRYKCTELANFNFCEKCESTIEHKHNMIKMKFVEKPKESESEGEEKKPYNWRRHCKPWKAWMRGFMPPHMQERERQNEEEKCARGGRCRPWKECMKGFMPPPPPPHHQHEGRSEHMHPFGLMKKFFNHPPPFEGFIIGNEKVSEPKAEESQKKEKEDDELVFITNKCFKLADSFGDEPEKYRDFVSENKNLRAPELIELYLEKNEKAEIPSQLGEKMNLKLSKLAFYFNEDKKNFEEIVKKYPTQCFKKLVKVVKEEREKKVEEKQEEKQEKTERQETECEEKKVESEGDFAAKRISCLEALNEFFGKENFFTHLKFFNENSALTQEEIIAKYIEKISK